jgi:hypothetical protein
VISQLVLKTDGKRKTATICAVLGNNEPLDETNGQSDDNLGTFL